MTNCRLSTTTKFLCLHIFSNIIWNFNCITAFYLALTEYQLSSSGLTWGSSPDLSTFWKYRPNDINDKLSTFHDNQVPVFSTIFTERKLLHHPWPSYGQKIDYEQPLYSMLVVHNVVCHFFLFWALSWKKAMKLSHRFSVKIHELMMIVMIAWQLAGWAGKATGNNLGLHSGWAELYLSFITRSAALCQ